MQTTPASPTRTPPARQQAAQQGANGHIPEVPDRPKIATGVRLAGQMQESAFENPPWLLERDGAGYVQVTELLYHIAEQSTGEHTIKEIASTVSTPEKAVNGATVRSLIAKLLIPRGLVESPNGSVAPVAAVAGSPLALNMRMKMFSPETITPITTLLKFLYWPPVLLVILGVAALAEGWLYFVHGIGSGIHDALYTPGLMLIVLVVIVVSAAFHELGHAAALHYAGGKIKGMGAGMYLVYPAFFTDVSDNYRLPRWSRVRTDLGGFYFNLIFALGIMGAFLVTGQEFLLLLVLMINLEIIHQLLPFLRLDGYWTLADLTGVPDFFSQMGAFVRSVLPVKEWKGRKLPALKWWAKAIFGVYILVTIPLLLLLLLMMIRSVPRVLATAWDSLGQQGQGFTAAMSQGNVLGVLGAAGQAFLLMIPTLGLAYTLFSLGKRLIFGLWKWGAPDLARRTISVLALATIAGLLGFMWLPQVTLPGRTTGSGPVVMGPLSQVSWEPIKANERGTIADAVAGVVATREPSPNREGTPGAQPAADGTPGANATPEADATAAALGTPGAQPSLTPVLPFTDSQTAGTATPAVPTQAPRAAATAVPPAPAAPAPVQQAPAAPAPAAPVSPPQPLPTPAAQPTVVRVVTRVAVSGTATPTRTPVP